MPRFVAARQRPVSSAHLVESADAAGFALAGLPEGEERRPSPAWRWLWPVALVMPVALAVGAILYVATLVHA